MRDAQKVVEAFSRISPEMSMQEAMCILEVARNNGRIHITELADKIGYSVAGASRCVSNLGQFTRNKKKKGLDLVSTTIDPAHRSYKLVSLTNRGKQLLKAI